MISVKTGNISSFCFIQTWLLLWLGCMACQPAQAQTIRGKVVDEATKEPIPFALIVIDNSNQGASADLDGNFRILLPPHTQSISIHLLGYEKKTLAIGSLDPGETNLIRMKRSGLHLDEIVIQPRENPALPIIQAVILNKPKYDIENLPNYICNTYSKTYFTFSDREGNEDPIRKDTAIVLAEMLLGKAYLFFMESVSEKKYKYKNISQEKIIASRVSGFKHAPFGTLSSQLQSFTFYSDHLELLGLRYVNPLSEGTFRRYNFEISDTVLTGTDTTILIKFSPKKATRFKGLKGLLYIYKNQYVLCNVLAEPSEVAEDGTGIKIQQLYEKVDSIHWFPRQANTENFINRSASPADARAPKSIIKGVSRLYVRNVNLDSTFNIRNRSLSVFHDEGFDSKDESYWEQQREDALVQKELRTYQALDSLGKKHKFDAKVKWFNALATGQFQLGYVGLDLKHLLRANEYEGLRLGLGLSTSNKLSRHFSIGGYGGYGFGDKAWKDGGEGHSGTYQ